MNTVNKFASENNRH